MIRANRVPNLTLLFWEHRSAHVGSLVRTSAGLDVSSVWICDDARLQPVHVAPSGSRWAVLPAGCCGCRGH